MFIQHLAKLLSCFVVAASIPSLAAAQAIGRIQADERGMATGKSGNAITQQAKTVVRGIVVDHTGSVVPNFTVEMRASAPGSPAATQTTASLALTAQTNQAGEFSADLPPGSYEVCVARFPKSCRTVLVEEAPKSSEYMRLQINPADDPASSELLDNHIRAIAGPDAKDCGRVHREDSPKEATKCALRAYKSHKAFHVRYDDKGIGDSEGAHAMAGDSNGNVYSLWFDSMGMDTGHLPLGATMPDGFHTKIIPCSQPVRLRGTRTGGELTCFADGRWLGDD